MRVGARRPRVRQGRSLIKDMGAATTRGGAGRSGPSQSAERPYGTQIVL